MRIRPALALVLLFLPTLAYSGPNAGGVLLLHANPSIDYSYGMKSYCGEAGLSTPSLTVTSVPWVAKKITVFFVLAAFPESARPRLKALSWGIRWDDSKLVMVDYGTCADFEVPDNKWPDSETGIGQCFLQTRTNPITELYWFAAYPYAVEKPEVTTFAVIPHPRHGGTMVDDVFPPNSDSVVGYGVLGFGEPGAAQYPGSKEK